MHFFNKIDYKKIIINYYNELLKRDPDEYGMNHFLSLLQQKKISERQLYELIKSSPEFSERDYTSIPAPIYPEKLKDMPDPKIVATYRIKNEERWIEKSLEAASELCQEIVVLDDGSTDNTVKICENFPSVVEIHKQMNLPFDDVRDKNKLLKMALKRHPDFIISLDGDEIIMPNMKQILKEDLTILYPTTNVFAVQFLEIQEKLNQVRINNHSTHTRFYKILFRLKNQPKNLHFQNTKYPGNSHSSLTPQNVIGFDTSVRSRIKILHYGGYDEELRLKKYIRYKKLDPENIDFFGYEHLIHPEKFCGPLQYAYLPKNSYVENIK